MPLLRHVVSTISVVVLLIAAVTGAWSAVTPEPGRFADLVIHDPAGRMPVLAERPDEIPGFEAEAAAWSLFGTDEDGEWSVHIDRRSGAPLLVEGSGLRWLPPGETGTLDRLEILAREFLRGRESLTHVLESELVLDRDASALTPGELWVLVFRREAGGVPVEGQRFRMYVKFGKLIAFGADRWGTVDRVPGAALTEEQALASLREYMKLTDQDVVTQLEPARKALLPVAAGAPGPGAPAGAPVAEPTGAYTGTVGKGVDYRLVWRFALGVEYEQGIWIGKVDAVTGEILAFYDDAKYARVLGGAYPVTNDGSCPDGCERVDMPMPWADVTIDGTLSVTGDMGLFTCSPGGSAATTNLSSDFVNISDTCGAVSESVTCDADLDLGSGAGTDCVVPTGGSAGNTHASRTNFYHLNRIKEKGRHYLPGNSWLLGQITSNVNINQTCNAVYNGAVNFYQSGGGCGNTGEIGGVIHHEWGHGLDDNDGGGFDNPSEAYADVVAILQERISCIGPGFRTDGSTCTGYGDTCLTCTGVREMDWDARTRHTPATPANFTGPDCPGGGGPCGRAVHCESYVPSESIYDFATRDLPASGLDTATAWQTAERLWFGSRAGSGGPVINCSLPEADSCSVGSWYQQMRMEDDDDGDLSNGTPHAAELYAAFARHEIACGDASDPENQSFSSCPNFAAPSLTAQGVNGAVELSWDPVPGASDYLVLRTELGCSYSQTVIATVAAPATTYTDDGVPNTLSLNYRVQARGAIATCHGPVSNCETVTAGALPAAGSISLDRSAYGCATAISLTVRDSNVGASTVPVTVESDTEPTPENLTLTETAPGSGQYIGSFTTSSVAPSGGDGLLSVTPGDTITARYTDDDDGAGGLGIERTATATVECTPPIISGVTQTGIDDRGADIQWTTDTAATSVVHYGESTSVDRTSGNSALTASHDERIGGLRACTTYFYSVESADSAGNIAGDDNGGAFYTFETLGQFTSGLRQCHLGEVFLEEEIVGCSNSLPIRLVDMDLNLDPNTADTAMVPVTSTTETDAEMVTLTETGPNTSVFTGSIPTGTGAPVPADGILQASDGDVLTVSYEDADDGAGSPAVSFATADADCGHAGIFNIRITNVTDESAVVEWSTSEPSTSRIDWGETTGLGTTLTDDTVQTDHAFTLSTIPECGRFFFRVSNTDIHGNTLVADAGGDPFGSNVFIIGGAVFRDEFDTDMGWTLTGEWEIDVPQGLGTGNGDPTAAFEGTRVLGHDLTGLGAVPGNFENGGETAATPTLDLSSLTQVELKFRRWLNSAFGWTAGVEVNNGSGWTQVFSAGGGQSSWSLQTVDISSEAAGQSTVRIRFTQNKDFAIQTNAAGWNVDRFIVRDGTQPAFEACGACAGAPAFGGAASAVDADPCGDSGVDITWEAAPGWGTGNGGTYAVYRDTDPAFIPGPANLIASGLTGTSFNDNTAPNDTTVHYVVRAENDETCSTGPNNGGVEDGNLVRLTASDATAQPAPGDLGDSLRVVTVNNAHVRLSWTATPSAAEYLVERADDPQGPFTELGRTSGTFFEDIEELGSGLSRYYRVTALDSCGNPGP